MTAPASAGFAATATELVLSCGVAWVVGASGSAAVAAAGLRERAPAASAAMRSAVETLLAAEFVEARETGTFIEILVWYAACHS
jgi:Tfp pilus assembly protein PilZ